MKKISQKVLATTLAASVLLGGGVIGLLGSKAFADTTNTTASQASDLAGKQFKGKPGHKNGGFDQRGAFGGSNLVKQAATILNSDEKSITDMIKGGSSLLTIAVDAGLTEEDLVARLTEAVTKAIDDSVSAGKITQEQANKQKTSLADTLKEAITNSKPLVNQGPGKDGKGRGLGNTDELAQKLNLSKEAVDGQVKLVQDSKPSKEDLKAKLTEALTNAINEALSAGQITQDQAEASTTQLPTLLETFITSAQHEGGHRGPDKGPGFLGNSDLLASILGVTMEELKAEQNTGKSLAEIAQEKGVSEDELVSKLKDGLTDQLKQFVQNKRTPRPAQTQAPTAEAAQ